MHFSTVFCGAALFAGILASPVADPNNKHYQPKCKTVYKTTKKTVTTTHTATETAPCPILSLPPVPILTSIGVTGTLVPVGSLTSEILGTIIPTEIIGRDAMPEPTPEAEAEPELEARNNQPPAYKKKGKCTVTKTKCGGTITKKASTTPTVTATPTNCPVISGPNVPILTSIGVTGTLVPIGSVIDALPTEVVGGDGN